MRRLPMSGHRLTAVSGALKPLLYAAALAIAVALYFRIAGMQSAVNRDWRKVDQGAYMHFAAEAYESRFAFTGGRNRMPLYPWMQALFYSPELSDEAFFEQGKELNALISLACLAALGAAFFRAFSRSYAGYALSVIAFLCFAIKAPWFQAEVLFYAFFAFAFMLSIESIRRPAWRKSIGVGLLFALAHFTKASALPAVLIYGFSFAVPLFAQYRRGMLNRQRLAALACRAIAPPVVFLLALFPYFNESKARYGHYLYNVNSTFYVWYDSWGEAKFGTKAAGDREGWPQMPAEEIPSLTKYLEEHTTAQILGRLASGAERLYENACGSADGPSQFGLCVHVGGGLLALACCLFARLFRGRGAPSAEDVQIAVFAGLTLSLYLIMYAWFAAIASGPRFMLALLIPLLWTVGLALRRSARRKTAGIGGRRVRRRAVDYDCHIIVSDLRIGGGPRFAGIRRLLNEISASSPAGASSPRPPS